MAVEVNSFHPRSASLAFNFQLLFMEAGVLFIFYCKLAAKNLFRHRRRTALTIAAISVGVLFFILYDSLLGGANRDGIDNIINYETGHLQVYSASRTDDDNENFNLEHLMASERELAQTAGSLPEVSGVASRLLFAGSIITGFEEIPVTGVGVDPQADSSVFKVAGAITKGRWFQAGDTGVILGQGIARLLDLRIVDSITLRTQTVNKTIQAVDFTITGIVASPDPVVNQQEIFLPLQTAQNILQVGNGVTTIFIRLHSLTALNTLTAKIKRLNQTKAQFKCVTWEEAASGLLAIMKGKRAASNTLLLLIFIISLIGVINTILLASLERIKEIGILKSLGMNEREIRNLFIFEGLVIGFLGAVIGIIIAVCINIYLVNVGISLQSMAGNMDLGFPIADHMYGSWNWAAIGMTLFFGLGISLLASYFPARKAARQDPVKGLRMV